MKNTKLTLVRHCKTLLNEQNKLQGVTDLPLSKKGKIDAQKLALALKNEKIDVIYTSQLKRAIQTAENINQFHNAPLLKEKLLNEMSYGAFEGMGTKEIERKYPELYKKWRKDSFSFVFPQGESLCIIKDRLTKFLKRILKQKKNMMVVAHGEVSRVILGSILNWSNEKIALTQLSNGSITILEIRKYPKILAFNSH